MCGYAQFYWYEQDIDNQYRERIFKEFKRNRRMDLKELTDQELEILIYEYKNERCDRRTYLKLIDERNRRNNE